MRKCERVSVRRRLIEKERGRKDCVWVRKCLKEKVCEKENA